MRDVAGRAYRAWKRGWRRLEHSDPMLHLKRRIRMLLGREVRTRVEVRPPKAVHVGWGYCPDLMDGSSVVYGFGVGRDLAFDRYLAERHGPEIHVFDPTPDAVAWVESQALPPEITFHPVGIADHDGVAAFQPSARPDDACHTMLPDAPRPPADIAAEAPGATPEDRARDRVPSPSGTVTCPVRRLGTILDENGHRRLDLLKLDVEGAEFRVLPDILAGPILPRQLLVEFHHRFPGHDNQDTRSAVDALHRAGYRIFHISPHGREYGFLRDDG